MTTRKPKPSEIFEGPNSSLRRTFEEATKGCCKDCFVPSHDVSRGHVEVAVSESCRDEECSCHTKQEEWEKEFYKLTATMDGQHRPKLKLLIENLLSSQSVLKGERRRVIHQIREEVKGEVRKCVEEKAFYPHVPLKRRVVFREDILKFLEKGK